MLARGDRERAPSSCVCSPGGEFVFRSQATLLSLAALALSFACSSDDGAATNTTRSYAGGTPDTPFGAAPTNGASTDTGTPATPATPASENTGMTPSAPAEPGSNPE